MENRILDIYIREMSEAAAAMKAKREQHERNNCIRCGAEITHFEETQFEGNSLTMTYKCDRCGCYAEQSFTVAYEGTEEIEQ